MSGGTRERERERERERAWRHADLFAKENRKTRTKLKCDAIRERGFDRIAAV